MSNNSVNKRYVPKLRFKGFEGEYSFEILNKYLEYEQPTKYLILNNENINEIGNVPVLTANKSFILGYVENELNNCYKKGECFIFDDFTTDIKYVNFLFKLRSSAAKIITTKNDNYINYFFYLLKSKKPETLGHKRHWIEITSKEKRFIPPTLKEQEKISIFLSLLDKQISLLENKLKLTEQIKDWIIEFLYKKAKQNKKIKLSEILDPRIVGHIIDLKGYTPISIMLHGKGFKENTLNVKLTKKGRKYYERFSGDLIIGLQNFHNGSIDILNDEYNKPIMSNAIASFVNKSQYPLKIIKYILLSKKHQQYLINIAEGTGQKEFTINKILDSYIWIPTDKFINKFLNLITLLELQIKLLNNKKEVLEKNKKFYLNNLFI